MHFVDGVVHESAWHDNRLHHIDARGNFRRAWLSLLSPRLRLVGIKSPKGKALPTLGWFGITRALTLTCKGVGPLDACPSGVDLLPGGQRSKI